MEGKAFKAPFKGTWKSITRTSERNQRESDWEYPRQHFEGRRKEALRPSVKEGGVGGQDWVLYRTSTAEGKGNGGFKNTLRRRHIRAVQLHGGKWIAVLPETNQQQAKPIQTWRMSQELQVLQECPRATKTDRQLPKDSWQSLKVRTHLHTRQSRRQTQRRKLSKPQHILGAH